MQKLIIKGKKELSGKIFISGSKNSTLPILAASILANKVYLKNIPLVKDIFTMVELLKFIGLKVKVIKKKNIIKITNDEIRINKLAPYKLVKTMRAGVLVLGSLLTKYRKAKVSLPGGCAIGTRPVDLHLLALKKFGAKIKIKDGYILAEAKKGLKGTIIKFPSISVGATENALLAAFNAKGKTILKNVTIDVPDGSFVFLIGRTGSGKSSLIKTIYGDLGLAGGVGNVVGYDLNRLESRQIPNLRRELGVVFQDFKLLPDRTIGDNLEFVLRSTAWKNKKEINDRIDKVLKMVGINLNKKKYPFELSGGEQQRVAIARALLNEPKLIIADEPTGNLDPQTSQEIMYLFKSLHEKGMTLLMATHDYQMIVKFPGKIFKCENGKVFEVIAKT